MLAFGLLGELLMHLANHVSASLSLPFGTGCTKKKEPKCQTRGF